MLARPCPVRLWSAHSNHQAGLPPQAKKLARAWGPALVLGLGLVPCEGIGT